jgi:hypothetical protein
MGEFVVHCLRIARVRQDDRNGEQADARTQRCTHRCLGSRLPITAESEIEVAAAIGRSPVSAPRLARARLFNFDEN